MRPSSLSSLSIAQVPAKLREKEQFPSKIVKIINDFFCAQLLNISKQLFFSLNCPQKKKNAEDNFIDIYNKIQKWHHLLDD